MKKVKIGLLLVMFCVASISAQGISVTAPKVSVTAPEVAVPAAPKAAAPEVAVPAAPEAAVPVAPEAAVPAAPEVAVPAAPEVATEPPKVTEQIPAVPESAPSTEQAVAQPAPVVLPPVAAKEPLDIKFHLGVRIGLGTSALRSHRAISLPDDPHAIRLEPAFSLGGGLAFAIEINSVFTFAPELQYTWYRANGEFVKENKTAFRDLHEAGASLHSFELPILARFSFSSAYIELGPQVGYNYYAKIYSDNEFKKPKIKPFAFGPSLGFGANINGILLGVRGNFGLLEYAKNTKGYPWAAQVSLTQFFF